jgi:hypothetical protein
LIVLGDVRGHETGKRGNRLAKPGQEKLPTLRAIGSGRIDTEVCNVTAGASSPANYGTTWPRPPPNSLADLQHAYAARSPRPSTHPGDPPQSRWRHQQQRRLLSAGHDPDDDDGMTITA